MLFLDGLLKKGSGEVETGDYMRFLVFVSAAVDENPSEANDRERPSVLVSCSVLSSFPSFLTYLK